MTKLVILGSGPAGLTASIYASRASLKPICITGKELGGQLMYTTLVENFPGFPKGIMGPELMNNMMEQAKHHGTEMINEEVTDISIDKKGLKKLTLSSGKTIEAEALVIATGSSPKYLGLENEQKFLGKGLHTCATCDGAFYKDKEIIIVGGGDSAMEEANFLSTFAKKVTILNRSEAFRASPIMLEKSKKNPKISIETNKSITKYIGEKRLTGVEITDNKTKTTETIEINGVFLAVGHTPNTQILKNILEIEENGHIKGLDSIKSNLPGVFLAGDVYDHRYRQAITSAGFGCAAALEAQRYLASISHK